jgi:hypothetical protein
MPGPNSFTSALVDELSITASSKFPVSIPELHKNLIRRLSEGFQTKSQWNNDDTRRIRNGIPVFTKNSRRTPVYITLSVNVPPRTIMLAPMPQIQETNLESRKPNYTSNSSDQKSPSVLLIVRVLEDEDHVKDKVQKWLESAPSGVIEFKGFYKSYSTLIIVKVALEIWDLLPPCYAVSFAGFAVADLDTNPRATPTNIPSIELITLVEDKDVSTTSTQPQEKHYSKIETEFDLVLPSISPRQASIQLPRASNDIFEATDTRKRTNKVICQLDAKLITYRFSNLPIFTVRAWECNCPLTTSTAATAY